MVPDCQGTTLAQCTRVFMEGNLRSCKHVHCICLRSHKCMGWLSLLCKLNGPKGCTSPELSQGGVLVSGAVYSTSYLCTKLLWSSCSKEVVLLVVRNEWRSFLCWLSAFLSSWGIKTQMSWFCFSVDPLPHGGMRQMDVVGVHHSYPCQGETSISHSEVRSTTKMEGQCWRSSLGRFNYLMYVDEFYL